MIRTLGCSACILMAAAAARAVDIPLTVDEPSNVERQAEVVSGGIPLPRGVYNDPAAFSLFDGKAEVPVQVSPIVKYPDGSLHWALVSFPVTLPAKGGKTFTLKDSRGKAKPANPVVVKDRGDLVEISNGLVSFTVNKSKFNGFESIAYKGKPVFEAAKAWLLANDQGGPAKPTHFDLVYEGSIRTTLYVKGPIGGQATPTFAVAITLNAGEAAIHIDHNLRNGGIGVKNIEVANPRLCLVPAGDMKAGASGAGAGDRPSYGWQEFGGPVDVLFFARHGGHAHIGGKELRVSYEPTLVGKELVLPLTFMKDRPFKLDEGEHKVTEVTLAFGKTRTPDALLAPLHARSSVEWYSAHDSMGVGKEWGSLADETATYKAAGWSKADDPKKMPHMPAAPDVWFNWLGVHDTSEADQIQGMLFGYLRTGERGYLDQALAWQRYFRTYYMYRTDDFTYGKEGRRGGLVNFGGGRTCESGCHTYGVGIFNSALLTGNVDALEAAFDLAEQANATAGNLSPRKPGAALGFWGSRSFVRNYMAVARAADVARTTEWAERVRYFVEMATSAADRDPRGFINHGHASDNPKQYIAEMAKDSGVQAVRDQEELGVVLEGKTFKHPQYGTWQLREFASWPEAMESEGHVLALDVLREHDEPAFEVAADDAMDLAIVKAQLGQHYLFDPVQKCVYYYMFLDYPIPGHAPLWKGNRWSQRVTKAGSDSWYTKWWPNPMAAGYLLTGDKAMRERMTEMLWWGLGRDYINPPTIPEGEAPPYARIDTSTKQDFMTPTVRAFGVGARPKSDETPPATIGDLKASAAGGKVTLTWTAPQDAKDGKATFYQVKVAESPLEDYPVDGEQWRKHLENGRPTVTYWNFARNVPGEPRPAASGKRETMTLELPAGKTYHLAIRSFDGLHNRSGMSNVTAVEVK